MYSAALLLAAPYFVDKAQAAPYLGLISRYLEGQLGEGESGAIYQPTERGYEAVIRERLLKWREILRKLVQKG